MIQLLHIDCMDYMATLPDGAFDLAIVDPPYGRGEDGGTNRSGNVKQKNGTVLRCVDGLSQRVTRHYSLFRNRGGRSNFLLLLFELRSFLLVERLLHLYRGVFLVELLTRYGCFDVAFLGYDGRFLFDTGVQDGQFVLSHDGLR